MLGFEVMNGAEFEIQVMQIADHFRQTLVAIIDRGVADDFFAVGAVPNIRCSYPIQTRQGTGKLTLIARLVRVGSDFRGHAYPPDKLFSDSKRCAFADYSAGRVTLRVVPTPDAHPRETVRSGYSRHTAKRYSVVNDLSG